jgi:hypothetical protein
VEYVQTAWGQSNLTDNSIIHHQPFLWSRGDHDAYPNPMLSLFGDVLEHDVSLIVLETVRKLPTAF